MSRDDIEDHINDVIEVSEDDPIAFDNLCTSCGDELEGDVTQWKIPEVDNTDVLYVYDYCSEQCVKDDKMAIVNGDEMHPFGSPSVEDEDGNRI